MHRTNTLYLLVGYPGSGKTTVAEWICEATQAVHIWADRERQLMFPNPTHSQAESDQLYARLNQNTERFLRAGENVVFDTSFNFRKDRDHLRTLAEEAGAGSVLVWLQTPKTLAKSRALHGDHADRNGYSGAMSEATFERIAGHLEEPTEDEQPICLIGTNLTRPDVLHKLGLL